MKAAPPTKNEALRLEALKKLGVLDTESDADFDNFTRLASIVCQTPIALISLVDESRQWFKSKIEIEPRQTPRDVAFCAHAIHGREVFVVEDSRLDERFNDNPLVTDSPKVIFYAGAPLEVEEDLRVGTLCVIDHVPRTLTADQIEALRLLALEVTSLLRLKTAERKQKLLVDEIEKRDLYINSYFNSAPFMMGLVELRGDEIIHLSDNKKTAEFFHATPLPGQPAQELEPDAQILQTWLKNYRLSEQVQRPIEFLYEHRRFGKKHRLKVNVNWIPDTSAKMFTYLVEDVTDQLRLEEELENQQAQNLQSARLASIAEVVGGIAHELNNPLAIILNRVERMRQHLDNLPIDPDILRSEAQKVESTVMRVALILKGLRSISRNAESDPFEVVTLKQVITETVELCRERFRSAGIELRMSEQPDIKVKCRPAQISQVFVNLLNNSYDAVCDRKDRWIEIKVYDRGFAAEIHVIDSGPPIAQPEKLFQPFYTTKELGKGTGLNLSSSRSILENHGGSLEFEKDSKHTEFVITLPKSV